MANIPVSNSPLYDIQDELKEKGYFLMDCPFCNKRHKNELCEIGKVLLFKYVERDRIQMKIETNMIPINSQNDR